MFRRCCVICALILATVPLARGEVGGGCGDELLLSRFSNGGDRLNLYSVDLDAGVALPIAGQGSRWPAVSALAAFGDVDDDGLDEIGVIKTGPPNPRFGVFEYDPEQRRMEELVQAGDWGAGHAGTAVAFGDVDGDGRDEMAIARHGPGLRFAVHRIEHGVFTGLQLTELGSSSAWGEGIFPTALAFGDVDGDGDEELAVGRSGGRNGRFLLYDVSDDGLRELARETTWGPGKRATALAFGDVDGDGRDELAVGRVADRGEPRFLLHRWNGAELETMASGGELWGPGRRTNALAFGDVDGDGRHELAVGRNGDRGDERIFLLRWSDGTLELLDHGAEDWGDGRSPVSLAFGDADGDGREELAFARSGTDRARFGVYRIVDGRLRQAVLGGEEWGRGAQARTVSFRSRRRDSDGDGLYDDWERRGIDGDCDGDVDLVLDDASPRRKDVYVEIDFMQQHRPLGLAIGAAVRAFFEAPVANPDGSHGIDLHVDVDEQLPHRNRTEVWTGDVQTIDPFGDFDDVKRTRFGTAAERAGPDADAVLAAKRLAYRYNLWVHQIRDAPVSGRAERGGNDFVVSLGPFTSLAGHRRGSLREQAGTLVHELGHTLGLRHGGGDDVNCKPNYLSVMSYTFQNRWIQNPFSVLGRLDYSRQKLPVLDEDALDERTGIGDGTDLTRWGIERPAVEPIVAPAPRSGAGNGPLDWDGDGRIERRVRVDLNDLAIGGCDGSRADTLHGHDDWDHLDYLFRDSPHFADGEHPSPEHMPPELTAEAARTLARCPADTACGHGDWERWCAAPPRGREARRVLACLRSTATFADVGSLKGACSALDRPRGDCGRARAGLLRLALDLCTARSAACCPLPSEATAPIAGAARLGDAFERLDRQHNDRVRRIGECRSIAGAARRIHTGGPGR